MKLRSIHKIGACCILAVAVMAGSISWSGARGVPASEGILNFGKANDAVYRGAQPDDAGLENLQRLGVKTIINLRMPGEAWQEEAAKALSHGILYTNMPFQGMGRPTADQIKAVLSTIDSLPGPVFVHCAHGCDRTGMVVACYRMQHDQWTVQKAVKEANHYGLSIFERGMRRFISDFPKLNFSPHP